MLRAEGWSNAAIGRVLGVTHQAVGGWFRSPKAEAAYERAKASGALPEFTAAERARIDEQPPQARTRQGSASQQAEASERTAAGEAGARVLRLHKPDGVGPLLTAEAAREFGRAAGRCVALWRALVFAGVDYFEAMSWAGRIDAGDPEALPLRSMYERSRSTGIVELLDRVWDGEGAPATAWQVLQRVAPEFAEIAQGDASDPLAEMSDAELLAGFDEVREHLAAEG